MKNLPTYEEFLNESKGGGDCYQSAGNLILPMYGDKHKGYTLVHGMVNGQGPLNSVRYGHAWVELDDIVFDYSNGRKLEIPKRVYYHVGQIKENDNIYYTQEETRRWILDIGTWGPWEMSGDPVVLTENIPEDADEVGIQNVKVSRNEMRKLKKL